MKEIIFYLQNIFEDIIIIYINQTRTIFNLLHMKVSKRCLLLLQPRRQNNEKRKQDKEHKGKLHFITKRGKDGSIPFFSSIFSIHHIIINYFKEGRENKLTNKPKTNSFSSSAQCLMKLFINYESKLPSITIEKNNCK